MCSDSPLAYSSSTPSLTTSAAAAVAAEPTYAATATAALSNATASRDQHPRRRRRRHRRRRGRVPTPAPGTLELSNLAPPSLPMFPSTSQTSFSRKHSVNISIMPSLSSPPGALSTRTKATAVTLAGDAAASAEIVHISRRTRFRKGEGNSGSTRGAT